MLLDSLNSLDPETFLLLSKHQQLMAVCLFDMDNSFQLENELHQGLNIFPEFMNESQQLKLSLLCFLDKWGAYQDGPDPRKVYGK